MLLHIGLLVKSTITVLEFANEGFFHCMDSQVIKKVVPLPKYLVTVLMSATKLSNDSSVWFEASKFINIKQRSLRSIVSLNGTQIKVFTFQNDNRISLIMQINSWVLFFLIC
jgi:hypothetical protein